MSSSPDSGGPFGYQDPTSDNSPHNALAFLVEQMMGGISTATLVRVTAVTNNGGITPVGQVDVQPLINQTDPGGKATPHGPLHGLPYQRYQGGTDAIIMDPKVGDIGLAVFTSRDASSVKANKDQANPGSSRRHDMADGFYVSAFLNGVPTQYIAFSTTGIAIVSPTTIMLNAPMIEMTSPNIAFSGTTLTHNGLNIGSTHKHTAPDGETSGPH